MVNIQVSRTLNDFQANKLKNDLFFTVNLSFKGFNAISAINITTQSKESVAELHCYKKQKNPIHQANL